MNGWLLTLGVAVVRGWTRLYTLPLDPAAQDARRAEIESDLWEFQHDRSRHESSGHGAAHLLIRALLGMPDDLFWTCEQLPAHPCARRLWVAVRIAVVGVAASTLVVSARGPSVDLTHSLRVNVTSAGWLAVGSSRLDAKLVPALSFTLTNVSDRALGALQVNALFYRSGQKDSSWGTAFSSAVGSRGLAPEATSRSLVLQPQGGDRTAAADVLRHRVVLQPSAFSQSRVKLFVKHEGHWTLLADYSIRNQLMRP